MADLELFARTLQQMMKAGEETNEALANEIASNSTYVSRWRNGHDRPSRTLFKKLLSHYANEPFGLTTPTEAVAWAEAAGYTLSATELSQLFPDINIVKPRLLPPRLPATYVTRQKLEHQIALALESSTPVVLVGMGGSGKTTLAIAVAQILRERFADGILWLNMINMPSAAALSQQLWQHLELFWPGLELQLEIALQSWLYAHQYLLCLDDITSEQARWLMNILPSGGQGRFLLTTRDRQAGQRLGAVSIDVGPLAESAGLKLLSHWAGQDLRKTAWAKPLADRLGHLPLALSLAGAQLQVGVDGAELLALLSTEQLDLRLLDLDDPRHRADSLVLWFDVATRSLTEEERLLFAQLGIFSGSFNLAPAAAVWNHPLLETRAYLQRLCRFALLEQDGGQYWLHPLLQSYARMKLAKKPELEQPARRRHAAWYIRYGLYHPGVLDEEADAPPRLDSIWLDVVTAVKWSTKYAPKLAAQAALLAHTERSVLLEATGPSLIDSTKIYLTQTTDWNEQATLYELLGELTLLEGNYADGTAYFEQAGNLWQVAEEGLASSQARLRQAGAYLLQQNQRTAAEVARQAQTVLEQSLPLAASEQETARWLFYWFEMIYNVLVRWESLPEADVANLARLGKETGDPILEARGVHIYRIWCTAEGVDRLPETSEQARTLTLQAYRLWRRCGRLDKADAELSWSQYFLTGRYSRRVAARFARRLSQTTPVVSSEQLKLIDRKSVRWWLSATEEQRVAWLSRMLPRVLEASNCSQPTLSSESRARRWVSNILNVGVLGQSGRRLTIRSFPPDGHILNGPEWQVLSGQKTIPLVGTTAEKIVKDYLVALEKGDSD